MKKTVFTAAALRPYWSCCLVSLGRQPGVAIWMPFYYLYWFYFLVLIIYAHFGKEREGYCETGRGST